MEMRPSTEGVELGKAKQDSHGLQVRAEWKVKGTGERKGKRGESS